MRTRTLLVPALVGLLAAGCGSAGGRDTGADVAGAPPSSATPPLSTTTLAAPPPTAELVQGDGPTDCPVDAVVARARPAAPAFPLGGSVTIYVTLTSTVDCRWRPMEFWRPFAAVVAPDGTPVGREAAGAPGTVALVVVQLRAGEEVLVHTSEWDEHSFAAPPATDELWAAAGGPLVAPGRYLAVATVDGMTPAPAEPFEVVA